MLFLRLDDRPILSFKYEAVVQQLLDGNVVHDQICRTTDVPVSLSCNVSMLVLTLCSEHHRAAISLVFRVHSQCFLCSEGIILQ